jgi:hypothetical protein
MSMPMDQLQYYKYHTDMLLEKSLEKSNDIPRLLSGEIKEICMAELFTLDESISELKQNLKIKFQVGFGFSAVIIVKHVNKCMCA